MIGSVVRSVVAPLLRDCPQACGIVALTEVEVSQDLSFATCYVSALKEPEQALAFLESRSREFQKALGQKLQIFRVPKVRFRIDPRTERGERLEKLLG